MIISELNNSIKISSSLLRQFFDWFCVSGCKIQWELKHMLSLKTSCSVKIPALISIICSPKLLFTLFCPWSISLVSDGRNSSLKTFQSESSRVDKGLRLPSGLKNSDSHLSKTGKARFSINWFIPSDQNIQLHRLGRWHMDASFKIKFTYYFVKSLTVYIYFRL